MGIPVAVLSRARRAADAFGALTGVAVDAAELLTGRAALLGLPPPGRISAGGATRLMLSTDGWCALTLSRRDDIDAVPALIESDAVGDDPWPAVQRWVADNASADVTARARLLGLPGRRPRRNTRRPTADHDAGHRGDVARKPPAMVARQGRSCRRHRPLGPSPTCPRCGPAPCALSCWREPAPPSSRSKPPGGPTAPGRDRRRSSTG